MPFLTAQEVAYATRALKVRHAEEAVVGRMRGEFVI